MVSREFVQRLPKAELHVHLDGCIRPDTMIELAAGADVTLPVDTPDQLAHLFHATPARDLAEYLERFEYTLSVMQTPLAIARIAHEFVHDAARENVRYVEVRYCPALHTKAMTLHQSIEAALDGIHRGERETGCRVGLIICALRTLSPDTSHDLARAAVDYKEAGVVAFDLAGLELGYPARDHVAAFRHAAHHGLACTCHAGEGDGPASVRQAIHDCGAQRIGHGTRIHEDPALEAFVREQQIPLEMCLSSNVNTNTVPDIAQHPIRRYFDGGCIVTVNTDSRLIDGITLSDEYWLAHTKLGFDRSELERLVLNAFESAFLDETNKRTLVSQVRRELGALT